MAKKKTQKKRSYNGGAPVDVAKTSKSTKDANGHATLEGSANYQATADEEITKPRMGRKEFEQELEKLHIELVKLQHWVKATNAKVCVFFEGRDAAGKGGVIKRITERVSPRVFRVAALP